MGVGGLVLRITSLALRVLQFLASAVILVIFSYFLALLSHNNQPIAEWLKAVEGLSGVAALYAFLGAVLVCFLGGIAFFAALGVVLDICFAGAMVAIAVLTRKGTQNCNSGILQTPIGTGKAGAPADPEIGFTLACELEKVAFAVSVIGIFLFLISVLFQILLARHHKSEKRFGPSPANGYTYGSGGSFFRRRNKNVSDGADALPGHPSPDDLEQTTVSPPVDTSQTRFSKMNNYTNSAYTGNI